MHAKLTSSFPRTPSFTSVLVAGEQQSIRVASQFLAVLVKGEEPNIPVSAPLLKCRAKAFECLRLRCMSRECPHRSASEVASLQAVPEPPDAAQEIHPDDCEVGDDGMFEEDDAEMSGPISKRDFLVDLWPFSRPESFYKQLLTMLGAAQSQVLVVASSTAHPSVVIAARDLKLQVHLLSNRSHYL